MGNIGAGEKVLEKIRRRGACALALHTRIDLLDIPTTSSSGDEGEWHRIFVSVMGLLCTGRLKVETEVRALLIAPLPKLATHCVGGNGPYDPP